MKENRYRTLSVLILSVTILLIFSGCGRKDAESRYQRGLKFYAAQDYSRAAIELQNALQQNPNMLDARFHLALCFLQLGQPTSAETHLRRVLEDDPGHLEARIELIPFQVVENDIENPLRTIQDAHIKNPNNARPLMLLAQGQLQRGALIDALNAIQHAAEIDSMDTEIKTTFARICLRIFQNIKRTTADGSSADTTAPLQWLDKAEQLIDKVLAENSNNVEALLVRAQILVSRGNLEAAERTFTRLLENSPNDPRALVGYYNYLFLMGKFDQAVKVATEAAQKGARSPLLEILLAEGIIAQGTIAQIEKNPDEAATLFEQARHLLSKNRAKNLPLAYVLVQTGKIIQAEDIYAPRLDQDLPPREHAQTLFAFGLVSLMTDKRDRCLSILNELEDQFPDSLETQRFQILINQPANEASTAATVYFSEESPVLLQILNNAQLMYRFGQQDHANDMFTLANRLAPHSALPDFLQASLMKGDPDLNHQREVLLHRAVEKDPLFPAAHFAITEQMIENGQYDEAAAKCKKLAQLSPDSVQAQSLLVLVLAGAKQYPEALRILDQVLESRPSPAFLQQMLTRLEQLQGVSKKPIEWSAALATDHPELVSAYAIQAMSYYQLARKARAEGNQPKAAKAYQDAVNWLNRGIEEKPSSMVLLQVKANLALETSNLQNAIDDSERILRLDRDSRQAQIILIQAMEQAGKTAEALQTCLRALEQDPSDSSLKYIQARLLARQGRTRESSALLRDLQSRDPFNPSYLSLQVQNAVRRGQIDQAIDMIQGILMLNPDNPHPALLLANLYQRAGRDAESAKILEQVQRQYPRVPAVRLAVAKFQASSKNYRSAIRTYTDLLRDYPAYQPALIQLAETYLNSGSPEKATSLIEQATNPVRQAQIAVYIAEKSLFNNKYDLAEQMYRKAADLAPSPLPALEGLARLATQQKDKDKTLQYYGECVDAASADLKAAFLLRAGDIASASWQEPPAEYNQRLRQAENYYTQALESSRTKNVPVLLRLSRLMAMREEATREESYLRQALAEEPDNMILKILLARALEKTNKTQETRKLTEEVLTEMAEADNPERILTILGSHLGHLLGTDQELLAEYGARKEDYLAQILSGLVAFNRARDTQATDDQRKESLDQALDHFEQAKQAKPLSPLAYRLLAMGYNRQGAIEKSLSTLQEWLEIRPSDALARVEVARLLIASQQTEQALSEIDKALEQSPQMADALRTKAYIKIKSDQADEGEQILRGLITDKPDDVRSVLLLMSLLGDQNRTDDAIQVAEDYLARTPQNYTVLTRLGELYLQKGEGLKALLCYQKTIEISPNLPQTKNNLAYTYAVVGQQLDKALTLAQQALNAYPGNPRIMDTLGFVYLKQGNWDKAIEVFQEVLDIEPKLADTRYHLALAYQGSGRDTLAREQLTKALEEPQFLFRDNAKKLLEELERSS